MIPLIAVAVAVPLMLLRNRRPRPLHPNRMWIMPLVIVALISLGLWASMTYGQPAAAPFGPLSWLILAVGLALGAALGWQRGRMVVIHRLADGSLTAQASPLGLILIVALLLSRQALRPWMEQHAADWHVNPLAIQDAFMLFAMGLVVVQRIEMWIRARRILAGGTDEHLAVEA
ncbi:hypothetical protein GCM10009101_24470 [Brevundimonas lenta]